MFDSVLNRAQVPRRRIGAGAAFAIAVHLWLLVGGIWLGAGGRKEADAATNVTFISALPPPAPPPPPPPPPPAGATKPKNTQPIEKKVEVDPDIYRPTDDEKKPEKPAEPEKEETAQEGGQEGGVDGGVVGGEIGGEIGGVLGGKVGGVLGGTGTGPVPSAPPPPTFSTLSIGDPNLDQKSCPAVGQPPYPQEARNAGVETTVVARCVVEISGSLTCSLIKTHPFLDASTKAFLASKKVQPFTAKGTPVRVSCNYPFRFKLE